MCIFNYWIYYAGPGCIVHLALTTIWVGQVYVGDVDGNVHDALLTRRLTVRTLFGILLQSPLKAANCSGVESAGKNALHVLSLGVAICPPTVEGLHTDGVGVGVGVAVGVGVGVGVAVGVAVGVTSS
jgi:hypothetical protein